MTFDAYETSPASGEPIFLYDFSVGVTHWRYTSADRPITVSANVYAPISISAGNIIQGQEIRQKTLAVTVPRDTAIVTQLQSFPPSTDLLLSVFALHYDDPDAQAVVIWIGRVRSQNQKASSVEISCEPAYTGIQTAGLRRRWQINCAHVLYAVGSCNVLPSAVAVAAVLASAAPTAFSITSPDFVVPVPGMSFAGGFVTWASENGYTESRTINSVSGTSLILATFSPDLVAGLAVIAYPGCNHTTGNCGLFPLAGSGVGNMPNYGGAPYIPLKNPFDGNPVY